MSFATFSLPVSQPYRATLVDDGKVENGRLATGNVSPVGDAATDYEDVYQGTIMAVDSNGLCHPCGWQDATGAGTGVNAITVADASAFKFGDVVELREADGTGVFTARNVTATTATTVTVDGATFNVAVGDNLLKTGAYQPIGFLDGNVATKEYRGVTAIKRQQTVDIRIAGAVRTSQVTGASAALKRAMSGGTYVDPQDGSTVIAPPFEGFIFQDNV